MAVRNKIVTWALAAGEDISDLTAGTGDIFKPVTNDGTIAQLGEAPVGLLQEVAQNGEHISVAISGISKYVAGGAVTLGDYLTVENSGYLTTAASGDLVVGQCLITVTSGSVGTGNFDFSTRPIFDSSSAHISTYEQYGFTAQADLSAAASANLIVNVQSGDFAADANDAGGVLMTGTTSGGTSYVRIDGIIPVKAGGVITSGQSVTAAGS